MKITQATITFNSPPVIKVGGKVQKDDDTIKVNQNTFAQVKKNSNGKYDVTIYKKLDQSLSEVSVKVQGGAVSRLKAANGSLYNAGPPKAGDLLQGNLNLQSIRFGSAYLRKFTETAEVQTEDSFDDSSLEKMSDMDINYEEDQEKMSALDLESDSDADSEKAPTLDISVESNLVDPKKTGQLGKPGLAKRK